MTHYAGLNVSVKETAICVVDDNGQVCSEMKIASHPEELSLALSSIWVHFERIGLEAGPLSQWLFEGLARAGLPVNCIETRHAKAFLKAQVNKTDRNDARGIAQMMRVKGDAAILKPSVQFVQILEYGHDLPKPVARIADVLLDLTFLPTRSRVAELWFKNILAGHGLEASIDVTLLASAHTVHGRLHIIVNPAAGNATKHAERIPMGVKQHLMRLQRIGSH